MESENMSSEISSYIVRGTENESEKKKKETILHKGKGNVLIGVLAMTLIVSGSLYGIIHQATASASIRTYDTIQTNDITKLRQYNENNELPQESKEALANLVEQGQRNIGEEKAEETVKNTETEELAEAVEAASGEKKPYRILSGNEWVRGLKEQEIEEEFEEKLSGFSWDYGIVANLHSRLQTIENEISEAPFDDEAYRELLVTMGIDEDYQSHDPKLPDYLTRTYNPLMDVDLTQEEIEELLHLVEAEAPAEDIYGKILVANVVMNRVFHQSMADDVIDVIYEKIGGSVQFSPTAIDWYWNSIEVTDSTREAVARCLSGEDYSNGALFFFAWERDPDKYDTTPWMQKKELLFTHGGHTFLR